MPLDINSPFGRRAHRRLTREAILWLTSVDRHGRPQPRPVWFHWDGRDLLIFSRPGAGKVRQLQASPHAAVHLNADEFGNDVVVMLGRGRIGRRAVEGDRVRAYLRKYRRGIEDLEMTPQGFLESYSVPIYIRPTTLRGF